MEGELAASATLVLNGRSDRVQRLLPPGHRLSPASHHHLLLHPSKHHPLDPQTPRDPPRDQGEQDPPVPGAGLLHHLLRHHGNLGTREFELTLS